MFPEILEGLQKISRKIRRYRNSFRKVWTAEMPLRPSYETYKTYETLETWYDSLKMSTSLTVSHDKSAGAKWKPCSPVLFKWPPARPSQAQTIPVLPEADLAQPSPLAKMASPPPCPEGPECFQKDSEKFYEKTGSFLCNVEDIWKDFGQYGWF